MSCMRHPVGEVDRGGEAEAPGGSAAMAVTIPTTDPAVSTSAPPDEPAAIGASVWSIPWRGSLSPGSMVRPMALITPVVTEGPPSSPSGEPIATAGAPTWRPSDESPAPPPGSPLASTSRPPRRSA